MIILFYISGIIAIISTLCVILNNNPIHALLYLILSLLSISFNFFSLKASFAGAIEIIVYAGAILILFMFVVMMLDTNSIFLNSDNNECTFVSYKNCIGILLLMSSLLIILLCSMIEIKDCFINIDECLMDNKKIGVILFGPYMLIVEIASFLLLGALISVLHISQEDDVIINFDTLTNNKKEINK